MPWPAEFRERMRAGRVHLGLILEVLRPMNGEGVGIDGWFAASDPGLGGHAQLLLEPAPRLGSSSVTPQSWTYGEGAWSCTLFVPDTPIVLPGGLSTGRTAMRYAARALKRGALVRLLIGEAGTDRSQYHPLKLGRLNRATARAPGLLEVEAWDLMTAFRTRLAASVADADEKSQLFYGSAGQADTLAASYSVGDSSFNITGSTNDRFLHEDGADGAVKIEGKTTTFYLSYGSATGSTLSGLSASGRYGTTASDGDPGGAVTSVALLEGHPVTILRKLLTSTGTAGANGARDVYPRPWSLGIPVELLNEDDFDLMRLLITTTIGSYAWRLLIESEQPDPAQWISDHWSPAGLWLTTKEGEIVVRAARDPNTQSILIEDEITERDLVAGSAPRVEWFPQAVPVVYHRSTVSADGGTSSDTSNVAALPAYEVITHDLDEVTVAVSSPAPVRGETLRRLAPWDHLVPEYVHLTLQGVRSYAPGDIVPVTLPDLFGRLDGTVEGYDSRACMVMTESVSLSTVSTEVILAALPTSYQEDSL